MDYVVLAVTLGIQLIAILMVFYTFHQISERNFPKLSALEKYHLMRKRYERLRWSLVFVGLLITIQLVGVFLYVRNGTLPLTQILISDLIVIALMIFLSRIYKGRERLTDLDLKNFKDLKEEPKK